MPVRLAAWVNGAFYGFEQAATAQAVPEWISVDDELPSEGDLLLAISTTKLCQIQCLSSRRIR